VKRFLALVSLIALAACSGDSTGSQPSLAGQWLFRMRAESVNNQPVNCRVDGSVRLTGSGSSFSGRMPVPEAFCSSAIGAAPTFDSTTTLTARLDGDSVRLTLKGRGVEIQQVARLLGDSLAGHPAGGSTGTMAARRFPDSVPLDRLTVQISGALTRTRELYAMGAWTGLIFASTANDEAIFLMTGTGAMTPLQVGTYTVGGVGAQLRGYHMALAANGFDDVTWFSAGTVTVTQADVHLVRGTFDVTGAFNGGPQTLRLQGDFTSHHSGWPGSY
jgi:hypothetical protein